MRLHVERQIASHPPSASRAASACACSRSSADPLAQLDGRMVVRGADEDEAHHAKWVAGRASRTRITSSEAGEREIRGAPAGPAHEHPQAEVRRPDDPGDDRRGDQRVEAVVVRDETTRPRRRSRAVSAGSDHATVRSASASSVASAGTAATQERRGAPLQPPLLPEVEPRQRRGEREAGERGEHEADVEDEEEVRVVAPRRRRRCRRPHGRRRAARPRAASRRARAAGSGRRQPQIRYAVTTSQTKRLSEPAHVPHGKAVAAGGLHDEQRRLREPAEPDAPRRRAGRPFPAGAPRRGSRPQPRRRTAARARRGAQPTAPAPAPSLLAGARRDPRARPPRARAAAASAR